MTRADVSAIASDKKRVDDLTKEFLVESQEGLDRMERCLTELETKPGDADLLADIFRAVHTIKGTTGFFALPRLEKLAHAGEHLLGLLRDGKLKATPSVVDVLLELLDGLRRVLALIETTGSEGSRPGDNDAELIAMLEEVRAGAANEGPHEAVKTKHLASKFASPTQGRQGPGSVDHTLRVDVETLDRMMTQVGELVLTRNQILQSDGSGEQFQQLARRLDRVTAGLHETVMRARTQPVGQLFQKFPRMVRDLARQCGRRVRLEFEGQETRLDKGLLEALKDPITHAVRNAVDHGIEPSAERLENGKAVEGVVRLSAYHEGSQVVIEVSDDGGGIDGQKMVKRALAQGLISAERGGAMSEEEALQLIFTPGFSTRDEVTTVSGRGVGMDVVRANVESVGGTVEIETKIGEGSTLRMRVPLTLAIIPALVVRCGGGSYVLPRSTVSELVLVLPSDEPQLVQSIGGARVFRLRDRLLPFVVLADVLSAAKDDANGYYVAVVEAKGRRFGLVVDDMLDPQEIVVKPLSRLLRQSGIFSGASTLGNGELAMILDVAGIAACAHLEADDVATASVDSQVEVQDIANTMVVFEDYRGERGAVALAIVDRIQRVPVESVEFCSGVALLQDEGGLMPLEDLGGLISAAPRDSAVTVVICRRKDGGRVGLVVGKVLEIAAGDVLPEEESQGMRLALVHRRLAALCEDFNVPPGPFLREIA